MNDQSLQIPLISMALKMTTRLRLDQALLVVKKMRSQNLVMRKGTKKTHQIPLIT